jgi:hypothetical protein
MKLSEDWGQVLAVVCGGFGIVYAVLDANLLFAIICIALIAMSLRTQQLVEEVRDLQS